METGTAVDAFSGWASFSLLTKWAIVLAVLASVLAFGLWVWAGVRMKEDSDKAAIPASNVTIIEQHNHFHIGDRIAVADPLPMGWTRKMSVDGRTTVEVATREEMDLGAVEMKTVAEVAADGEITALFRFINILEGGSWDVNSWTVLRDAGGQEVPLVARFKAGQFGDRLQFADDIICVGLSSKQQNSDADYLTNLSYQRAMTLGRAVVKGDVVQHPQTIYTLHLGGARVTTPLGAPSEPGQRAAVIIGVQRANKDAVLSRDIGDVVARAELTTTKLTDYEGADDPDKRLRLGAPDVFKDPPPTTKPTGPARKVVGE